MAKAQFAVFFRERFTKANGVIVSITDRT